MNNKQKNLALLKALYDPKTGDQEHIALRRTFGEMSETEQVEFNEYAHVVGNAYTDLLEELDEGLTELADAFPDESDPRKWDDGDWVEFFVAVAGHKYEEFYITYASQKPNFQLVWQEIEQRIG